MMTIELLIIMLAYLILANYVVGISLAEFVMA